MTELFAERASEDEGTCEKISGTLQIPTSRDHLFEQEFSIPHAKENEHPRVQEFFFNQRLQ